MGNRIVKTVVSEMSVDVILENGVTISLNSNRGYVNLSFAGINVPVVVENRRGYANILDIEYSPTKKD